MSSQGGSEIIDQAPLGEQKICVNCGFCCDGTLFLTAGLKPGERGHLPEKIEKASYRDVDNEYFRLPCGYFSGRCSIYDRQKAYVCSAYRCQLLKDFSDGKVTMDEALETVREAVNMREEIFEHYRVFSGKRRRIYFRKLLREMGQIQDVASSGKTEGMEYDLLLARCNIFEALLIKHFRSGQEFEKLVMK